MFFDCIIVYAYKLIHIRHTSKSLIKLNVKSITKVIKVTLCVYCVMCIKLCLARKTAPCETGLFSLLLHKYLLFLITVKKKKKCLIRKKPMKKRCYSTRLSVSGSKCNVGNNYKL